jgi:glucans biosynthesis protein
MRRRRLILGAIAAPALVGAGTRTTSQSAPESRYLPTPFDDGTVPSLARALAAEPHRPRRDPLPPFLARLDYDGYRRLRFDRSQALWRDGLPFQLQPHHRGFLFHDRAELFEVAEGQATRLRYRPEAFRFDDKPLSEDKALAEDAGDLGFAGFRLLHPLNRPDHFDEVCSFLGASYFRALGRGHVYGLSARGLAINTAEPSGEEFPAFTAFWIERPRAGDRHAIVHALLESPSLTGAWRFAITPGEATTMEVQATLHPRRDVRRIGLAPATSMFYFAPHDRARSADWRGAVHDSDGLLVRTGAGEQIWRPLANPQDLQLSGFQDEAPQGFGLMQRSRAFAHYADLEAAYHRRPSLWAEPLDQAAFPWGPGEVTLVEIPTKSEIHDNIASFWSPHEGLRAGTPRTLRYRLTWLGDAQGDPRLLRFAATRHGLADQGRLRHFVLDTTPEPTPAPLPEAEVQASAGAIENAVVQPNPETGGLRLSFHLRPGSAKLVELKARLLRAGTPVSESWVWRWTS